jgi:hypothetical protein
MKKFPFTILLWSLAWTAAHCFPIPLPSPVPANETPFANLQPGQYAVLKNITTNNPTNDHKACAIRLSQKFDKSGQAAVIYVIKEDIIPPTDGQWSWIDKYNIVLVNLGLWDDQPFYTTGYDEADIMIEYGSELTGWQAAVGGVNGVTVSVTSGIESGMDEVNVRIPRALARGSKFFARLSVMIP